MPMPTRMTVKDGHLSGINLPRITCVISWNCGVLKDGPTSQSPERV